MPKHTEEALEQKIHKTQMKKILSSSTYSAKTNLKRIVNKNYQTEFQLTYAKQIKKKLNKPKA